MDVKDAGRKGGEATKAKKGSEFYAEIGRKGGQSAAKTRGPEFYAACAAKRAKNRTDKQLSGLGTSRAND